MTQKPRSAAPTLQDAKAAGNPSDIDVEQQLLGQSAGGDGPHDGTLGDVLFPDVSVPNVPFPNPPLPDVHLPEARPDGSVGEESTHHCISEEV
jgi:hypothetical protein